MKLGNSSTNESTSGYSPDDRALLESSIESIEDVLIFAIDARYMYLIMNNAFREATRQAYGLEPGIGKSMLESIKSDADRARAKSNCDRALHGEYHTTTEEYGTQNRVHFETRYCPIRNNRREIVGVTVLSINITQRKEAEARAAILNSELAGFSYSVAHDLRAPLRVIDGYVKIMLEDHPDQLNAEGKRLLAIIARNARQIGQLIDDLLSLSGLGRATLTAREINMGQLVDSVIAAQREHPMGRRVQFKVSKIGACRCDANLMKHVVANLISNAMKYSSQREVPVVEIGSSSNSGEHIFFVKDNGIGFDMKYHDKIYGVFQRLHGQSQYEGTGIGLAIAKKVIERHGGRLWAESEVNKGATFYFSVPQ